MLPAAMTPVGGPCSSAAVLTVCRQSVCGGYPVDRPTVLPPSSHSLSRSGQALATAVTASSPW